MPTLVRRRLQPEAFDASSFSPACWHAGLSDYPTTNTTLFNSYGFPYEQTFRQCDLDCSFDMKLTSDLGRRLLPAAIDQLAESEPSRPWASVPRDNEDLTQGYVDITYGQFANAINHAAAWLHSTLGPSAEEFETIAYEGPNDIRLPAIAVAAAKVGRKVNIFMVNIQAPS